jgi:arylsulfatase A-like enzyme
VVILEIHGLKKDVLHEALDSLPHFREMILGPANDQSYVYLPNVYTTIPAASQPGVTSMYTGFYPGRTGVVSTIWFDRGSAEVKTLVSWGQQRINRILEANQVRSLFDHVRDSGKTSLTAMLMLTKGAQWSIRSGAFFWGNASVLNAVRNGKWIPESAYLDHKTVSGLLDGHVFSYWKSFGGLVRERGIVPDVTVVQLLGMDIFSHYPSPALRERGADMMELQAAYAKAVLDPQMGRLIQAFRALDCYEDMIFFFISEHGFLRITKHIPDDTVDRSLEKTFSLPTYEVNLKSAQAVVMPGACTKEVYLKNRASGSWLDPPRLSEDVRPAVDLILKNPDVRESAKTLLVRRYPGEREPAADGLEPWWVFDVASYLGGPKDADAFYRALRSMSRLSEIFELGPYLEEGLKRQYTRETAPDLKIVNKKGHYFERDFDKYGHHGSYYPDDCIVSFWVAGPGLARVLPGRHRLEGPASTLDLVPMVTQLLGMKIPAGLDGRTPLSTLPTVLPD